MSSVALRNDTLIEISTFLVRRWSENDKIIVTMSPKKVNETRMKENKVILTPVQDYNGDEFARYRQFRTAAWYEGMKIKNCEKILSNDHAFGFLLNSIERRRIELVGRKVWQGMDEELIFNYSWQWIYRPLLSNLLGKSKIVEGFYQYFLFGNMKGEMQQSHFERVIKASDFAKEILDEALKNNYNTEWIEKHIPKILTILDIDPLITIPLSVPMKGPGMMVTPQDFEKAVQKITKNLESELGKIDPKRAIEGKEISKEFDLIKEETKKNENKGLMPETIGIQIPNATNADETKIYDQDLISNLKNRFREWKTGWKEEHVISGEEFDEEAYLEGFHKPFITDVKKSIKSRIVILLDHSSSVSDQQIEYKKATIGLCEVLAFLKVDFSVYAFNTVDRQVVCWLVKPSEMKWNNSAAKRLAQISANGGTPLAEVYDRMLHILTSKKPDIFLTLSDGEPADANAVKLILKSYRALGIKMTAIGVGRDTFSATSIANNLKYLGYDKVLAVSRLPDIPNRVLSILSDN
uniref:von Willebrand factor type A domain-containing protein n=1 Tax=uncultured marine thaumarchaeote AD1000_54_F09 TaxID=1455926 RepID=A0A075FUG5_9ARCH|nr:von Willebrand factor type A domain-containing protein [uncultured marine thaumarchaeote AD1000_54_F09]